MRDNVVEVSIRKKRRVRAQENEWVLARNRISALSTTDIAKSLVPFQGPPLFRVGLPRIQMTRSGPRFPVAIGRRSRGLFPNLIWDFETIIAVNPRYHLSRELNLPTFFSPRIQRHRLLGMRNASFRLHLSLSVYPTVRLFSLPVVLIPLSIPGRKRDGRSRRGVASELISARFGRDDTKRFLRRTSRTNELSFRIVNLPRNEMKRWNVVLAPSPDRFYGGSRALTRAHVPGREGDG